MAQCALGQKIYTEGGIQLYNLAFTSVPIILSGISDMDIPPEAVRLYPELYAMCIDNEYFTVSADPLTVPH